MPDCPCHAGILLCWKASSHRHHVRLALALAMDILAPTLSLILTMAAVSTCAAKAFLIVKRTGVHVTV